MTIGLTWRRTARRIKRLKEGVLTISPDYSDRPTPDFLALSYVADGHVDHGALDSMIGGVINLCNIEENWDETLRMTASIRAGTVAPSALLHRLAAYPRQNALARALREIGCLERTLFILDWISDPALRRRSNAELNKGEARNALARALFLIVTARSGTAPSKISATGPLV